jgi:hypothetical protein
MVYNELCKNAHYKWRETHKDQYREYVNKSVKKHYQAHKDDLKKKSLDRYYYKKEIKEFMNILL